MFCTWHKLWWTTVGMKKVTFLQCFYSKFVSVFFGELNVFVAELYMLPFKNTLKKSRAACLCIRLLSRGLFEVECYCKYFAVLWSSKLVLEAGNPSSLRLLLIHQRDMELILCYVWYMFFVIMSCMASSDIKSFNAFTFLDIFLVARLFFSVR